METFNFDVDDCFIAACNSLGQEMSNSKKRDLENEFSANNKSRKKNLSFYKKLEITCLIILVKLFI